MRRASALNLLTRAVSHDVSSLNERELWSSPSGTDGGIDDRLIPMSELSLEERPFAAGGSGMVYKGTFKKQYRVAAKVIFSSLVGGDFTEFFAELEVMKSLRHPNIVRLFGMGRVWSEDVGEEQLLIVTELCFGDLTSIIRPEVTVEEEYTPARLGEVCAQLLTGVAYMHRAGYAHKDLKPSNVLLAADGTVKLCDLGMASAARDRCLTLDVGTFAYMPPEAFSSSSAPVDDDESGQQPTIISSHSSSGFGDFGNNDADDSVDSTKWDVYSLAVMLVELWAGRHPWEDLNPNQIVDLIGKGERPDFTPTSAVEDDVEEGNVGAFAKVDECECCAQPPPSSSSSSSSSSSRRPSVLARAVSTPEGFSRPALPPALWSLVRSMWAQAPSERPTVADVNATFQATLLPALSAATEVECWLDIVERWDHYEETSKQDVVNPVAAAAPATPLRARNRIDAETAAGSPTHPLQASQQSGEPLPTGLGGAAAAAAAESVSEIVDGELYEVDAIGATVELVNGWNARGGDANDRRRALEYFAPHLLPLAIAGGRAEEEDEDDDDDDDDDTGGVGGKGVPSEEDYWERRINQVVSGAPAVDSRPARFSRGNSLGVPAAVDMERWYLDSRSSRGSPWCLALRPRKWKLEGFQKLGKKERQQQHQQRDGVSDSGGSGGSGGGSPSRKKKSSLVEGAVMISTSTTFLFEVDEYEDLVTLPLLGTRKTRCKFTAIPNP
jgi:serine/threonine protein kinase